MRSVLVAMSGGVDSAAAAILLREQGYTVAGATMLLHDGASDTAEETCRALGIPYYPLGFRAAFAREVIAPFRAAYQAGLTPNPCVFCNRALKFGAFLDAARELGYDGMATGHYARRVCTDSGRIALYRAQDEKKDQTYMLYQLTQPQLARVLFPLGGLTKQESRAVAARHGLASAEKADSQDICFIPDGDYFSYLTRSGLTPTPGSFRSLDGNVLAPHRGAEAYTIGQRRGLGVGFGARAYVVKKRGGDVYLGTNDDLFSTEALVRDVTFLDGAPPDVPQLLVKLRYSARPAPCTAQWTAQGAVLRFDTPQRAVTPGQSAVFYDGDRLLGGGILTEEKDD